MTLESWKDKTPHVDPTAYVHDRATVIGEVSIGAESTVWPGAVLRGDDGAIVIGERTSIQDLTLIHATTGWSKTSIGSRVTVGHRVILHGCTVEDDCLIGMGAILLDNCVVGRGSFIGAGALVTVGMVIPPGSFVLGMPAKIVRACGEKERAMIEMGWREYVERCHEYRERDGQPANTATSPRTAIDAGR